MFYLDNLTKIVVEIFGFVVWTVTKQPNKGLIKENHARYDS